VAAGVPVLLVRPIVLCPTVLGGGLSDTLLKGSVESRIGIKSNSERYIQYCTVSVGQIAQQFLGM
jgi:hypothetical protein